MPEEVKQNNRLGTALKWGIGGLILWSLLNPETKNNIYGFFGQLNEDMLATQRRKQEQERRRQILESLSFFSPKPALPGSPNAQITINPSVSHTPIETYIEVDADWRKRIIHPSVVLLLGKRGSGKSALGYRMLELLKGTAKPYVVGAPSAAGNLLPDWVGFAPTLDDIPPKSVALIDEAYLPYHARGSMAAASREMSQTLNLSRQREQTLIFVSQEARQVDKNIASSANVIIFKDLGILQLEFDRRELNRLATQAREAFATVNGEKRKWGFVYAPDSDYQGLMSNELPSFWKPNISKIFATERTPAKSRAGKKPTPEENAEKARTLREQGASYGEIAQVLGVTRSTVLNYIRSYPYRKE